MSAMVSNFFVSTALRPGATMAVPYPIGTDASDFATTGVTIGAAGSVYVQGTHFTIAFSTALTVTWIGPSTLPVGTFGYVRLLLDEPADTYPDSTIPATLRVEGASGRIDFTQSSGDTVGRARLVRNGNRLLVYSGGDGTAINSTLLNADFQDDATTRFYKGAYVGPAALAEAGHVSTDHRPPLTYAGTKRLIGAPARMNGRTSAQRLVISATGYYQIGGLDQHRDIVIANLATGTWLDFVHAPKGATFNIICEGTAVVHIYTGEGTWVGDGVTAATLEAHSWVNDGSKRMTSSAGAWLRVRRSNTTFLAIADRGTIGTATASNMPSADMVVGFGPQSWGVDLRQNSAAGAVPTMETLSLGSKFYSPDTANVGASTLLYFAAKSTLFHWDQRTDVPGQRLIDIAEAIKADRTSRTTLMGSTSPAMSTFVWFFGLNELDEFGPASTYPDNNPAVYTASFVKACQWLDAELGYNLVHVLIPLTSQKTGTFDSEKWYALRMAQLRCVAAGAAASPAVEIVIAPEVYGDPRSGDEEAEQGERHYDYPVHAVQAERVIMVADNALNAATNYLGPEITGVSSADSGAGIEWNVVIDYGTGNLFHQATRPEAAGFRMLPAAVGSPDTDDFTVEDDCLAIRATRWTQGSGTTINLRVTLTEPYLPDPPANPRPAVLWGEAEATDELNCVIYALHPTTSKRYYLRQYLYP